ncbi:MarC family protein [Pseudodesulfovibrio sp. S3]|uniref:MarC family protein n=1 Tax=unclassified Pseudodesulfovibrio TaxID=2661612 RepID=UPI000FEBD6B7|nr:MarC family protein [Pseudodesulfovibrio sp. S3]MCJ2163573.1 MarC family protein [Pseudodesulfovibrio sp. S3-i]RWU06808.1 MarC family protein [Pseudodesulfovibrio sp. S3]
MTTLFISLYMKLFFLLTPFFVLSVFLTLTEDMEKSEQRRLAIRTTTAVLVIALVLYFAGNPIFSTLGITLDGFRVGAGSLLFLSAVSLLSGKKQRPEMDDDADVAVVPLAIPITVGPASIGTLLILGAELSTTPQKLTGAAALVCACLSVGLLLFIAPTAKRVIGKMGLNVMTKITGLVLSAMAAQIVFVGVKNFLA